MMDTWYCRDPTWLGADYFTCTALTPHIIQQILRHLCCLSTPSFTRYENNLMRFYCWCNNILKGCNWKFVPIFSNLQSKNIEHKSWYEEKEVYGVFIKCQMKNLFQFEVWFHSGNNWIKLFSNFSLFHWRFAKNIIRLCSYVISIFLRCGHDLFTLPLITRWIKRKKVPQNYFSLFWKCKRSEIVIGFDILWLPLELVNCNTPVPWFRPTKIQVVKFSGKDYEFENMQ